MWGLSWLVFACCRGLGGIVNDFLTWPGWIPISKLSFMTYLVHQDWIWILFSMQVLRLIIYFFVPQNYTVDWTYLQNTGFFLGNLIIALFLGLLTSVAWELPLAKIQKLVIGLFVSQMSKKPFPKWTLAILIPLIALALAFVANFLRHFAV